MDAKTKFLKLKKAWKGANEVEREQIENETDSFFNLLSENEKKEVLEAIDEDFKEIHKEIEDIKKVMDIRRKLSPILPVISISYLAKNYFHKTPQWFYQRLNGNKVNGKPAKFSDTEIQILSCAIQDIKQQLSAVQL